MMMQEFEKLTGFYPTAEHYAAIEDAYYAFGGDKVDFCKAFKANKDGMAEAIARKVSLNRIVSDDKAAKETTKRISDLEAEVERLRAALDRELEWKPYESEHNVSKAEYETMFAGVESGSVRVLSDEEAKDYIFREFGFAPSSVCILREVDVEEVNRHGSIRKAGSVERLPLYGASDENYIRFDAAHWSYEIKDGCLRKFW